MNRPEAGYTQIHASLKIPRLSCAGPQIGKSAFRTKIRQASYVGLKMSITKGKLSSPKKNTYKHRCRINPPTLHLSTVAHRCMLGANAKICTASGFPPETGGVSEWYPLKIYVILTKQHLRVMDFWGESHI